MYKSPGVFSYTPFSKAGNQHSGRTACVVQTYSILVYPGYAIPMVSDMNHTRVRAERTLSTCLHETPGVWVAVLRPSCWTFFLKNGHFFKKRRKKGKKEGKEEEKKEEIRLSNGVVRQKFGQ